MMKTSLSLDGVKVSNKMKPSTKMFVVTGVCGIFFLACLFGLEGDVRFAAVLPGILAFISACCGADLAVDGR